MSRLQVWSRIVSRPRAALVGVLGAALAAPALSAQASGSVSANVAVYARVYETLTITGTQPMEFGEFYPSVLETGTDYDERAATISTPSSGAAPAYFTVTGHGGAEVQFNVTWADPSLATPADPTSTLALTGVEAQLRTDLLGSGADVGALESIVASGDGFTRTLSGTEGSSSTHTLYVGGRIDPVDGQSQGLYEGSITVDVNYTGS